MNDRQSNGSALYSLSAKAMLILGGFFLLGATLYLWDGLSMDDWMPFCGVEFSPHTSLVLGVSSVVVSFLVVALIPFVNKGNAAAILVANALGLLGSIVLVIIVIRFGSGLKELILWLTLATFMVFPLFTNYGKGKRESRPL